MMSIQDRRITNRATQVVKSEKVRFIRPVERQRMRPWLIEHLDKNDIPGLVWQSRRDKVFRISWKHAANQCFNMEKDTNLFERWAIHTGRHQDSDHKRWKANFRCALNSLPDVEEMKEHGIKKGNNAFKVYRFLDERETKVNKESRVKKKREAFMMNMCCKDEPETTYTEEEPQSVTRWVEYRSLPKLPQFQPSTSGVDMLIEAGHSESSLSVPVNMDNLQDILAAATASLAAGSDALALEKISIEQLSRLGEVSKMKLGIQASGAASSASTTEHMYVFLCHWCEKVFPSKVELFQHFLITHQEKLLSGEDYQKAGTDLQREIEDLEKKVLNYTRENLKKEASDVIEDGQVVDINTTNLMTSQEVYVEDQALDLSVSTQDSPKAQPQARQEVALDLSLAGRKIKMSGKGVQKVVTRKRKSSIKDADYIVKFGNYGLAGAPRTKRQMSLLLKNKKEEEKAKKSGGESDTSKQHSMEDLVHAEILISLKRSTNESEDGEGEQMETDEDTDGSQDQDKDSVKGETENDGTKADDSSEKDSKEKEAGEMDVDDKANVPLEDVMLNEEGIKKLGPKSAECKKCAKEEGKSETTCTHDTEHKPDYLCGMCHHIFDQKDTYVTHLESHFPPIEVSSESGKQAVSGKTPHTCEICKLSFSSLKTLEHHNKNAHYTVIPMRISGDKDSMTMVVHPSNSLIMSSLKEAKESTADLLKMTAKMGKPEALGVQGKDKMSKVTKESSSSSSLDVTGNTEDKTAAARKPAISLSEEEKGDSHGNDSVDGVPQTKAIRSGIADLSEAKTLDAAKNQEESQLPAFSEIVRDVDEFFIKDVKTEKKMDNDKQDVDKEDGTVDVDDDASDMPYRENRESTNVPDVVEKDIEDDESTNDTFKCMVCNKTFKDETFFEHMKVHSVYELAMSKIRIDKLKGKEISESSESGSKSSKFHCKLCNECFETFAELTSHFTDHLHPKVVHTRNIEITTEAKDSDAPKRGRKRKNLQSPVVHKVLKEEKSSKEGKEDKGTKATKEDKVEKDEKHKMSKEGKSGKGTAEQKGSKKANEDKSKPAKEDSSSKEAKDAKSKSTSILAAALKTAPIYDVTGSVTAGSVPTAETEPTASGDNSDSHGNAGAKTNLTGIETSNVSFVSGSASGVGKQSTAADVSVSLVSKAAVSEGEQSVSAATATTQPTVTVLTPGMMQNFASKLLVQGMQTYLLNSTQPNVLSASPAAVSSGQVRPQTVRVVNPATGMVTTKIPTMASSLGPVRLVTTDPKLSQQPQVILLKPGINLNAIPVQISSTVPSASVTQSMLVTAKTCTAQQEMEKHQAPGNITAQLSNVAATVVPAVRQVLQQSSVQGSGIPQGGTKINIPWSVLQNISNISITPSTTLAATPGTISLGTAVATCSAGPAVATIPVVTSLPSPVTATAATKVNPQVQSNLLNMMLARMSQPPAGGQKPANSPVTVGLQASGLVGPKVSTNVQPQSNSDEAAQTVTRRDIKSALAQGLVVICSLCKTQLTSSDISKHSCSQARQSQPVTPPATASATSGASVSGSSVTQAGEEHSKPLDVTPTQTTAQMSGVHVSGGYIIGLPGSVTVAAPDIEEDVAEIVKKDPEKYLCIFRCSKCSFSSAKMESALQHTKLAHDPLPHPCRFLKLQVSSKSGKERKVGVSGQCKGCGLVMNVLEKQHIASASPGDSLLKPGTVKYKLASSIAAKRLDKTGNKASGNSAVSAIEAESVTDGDTPNKYKSHKLFTCPDCNSLFGSLFQLKQHKVIRHGSLPARRARVGLVQPHRPHRVERKFRDSKGYLNKASVKGHTKTASSKHEPGTSISKTDQPPDGGSEKKDVKSEALDKEETCDIENC